MEEKRLYEKFLDLVIDSFFKNVALIGIFLLGFILRLIAGINLMIDADSTHFVTHAINFASSGKLVTYDQSSGLWFIFTDWMYKLFGINMLSAILPSLIFGSLSIIVIYLLSLEFFGKKTSLIASFLIAVSPFQIKNTMAGMDAMAMFFVLLSVLLFVRAIKSNSSKEYLVSGIFLGISIYTKVYPLLFIPSLLVYFVYCKYEKNNNLFKWENMKMVLIFLFAVFIFCIPAIAHNYLLYKNKGFLDLQFTRTTGLGKNISAQYYSWDAQFNAKNDWFGLLLGDSTTPKNKTPTIILALMFFLKGSPLNFIIGFLAFFILLSSKQKDKNYAFLFLFLIMFLLPFLASIMRLSKHYIFIDLFIVPLAANLIYENIPKNDKEKKIIRYVVIAILVFSFIHLGLPTKYTDSNSHFYTGNSVNKVMNLKNSLPHNAVLVGDNRIYRGRLNWMFYGRPYFEVTEFVQTMNSQDKMSGDPIKIDFYFFECLIDDCGWGTIKNQPEFNKTMEEFFSNVRNNSILIAKIKDPSWDKAYYPLIGEKEEAIAVYKIPITVKQDVIDIAKKPRNWFLYEIGYPNKNNIFDLYSINNPYDGLIDLSAKFIAKISLMISFGSILYLLYIFVKSEKV